MPTQRRSLVIISGIQQQISNSDSLIVGTGIDRGDGPPGGLTIGGAHADTITIGGSAATSITLTQDTTLSASKSLLVPSDGRIDSVAAGALNIGTTTATSVVIGNASTTAVTLGSASTLTTAPGNVRIEGDLTVLGVTVTAQSQTLLIGDNHIDINAGYTDATPETGGIVVNYLPTTTATTVNGAYVPGVVATSNPTVTTTASGLFAVGDIIQISGSNKNNGVYEVLSHVGTTLTIRGIGLTGCVEDFTQNQFTADPTDSAAITKINVSIMRAGTDGEWEVGKGSSTGIVFTDLATALGVSLQSAYQNGATITTTAAEGNVTIDGDQDFVIGGSVDVSLTTTGGISGTALTGAIDLQTTAALTLEAGAASSISTTAGALDITSADSATWSTSSGLLTIQGAAGVNLDGGTADVSVDSVLAIAEQPSAPVSGSSNFGKLYVLDNANYGTGVGNALHFMDEDGQGHYLLPDGLYDLGTLSGAVELDFDPALPISRTLTLSGNATITTANATRNQGRSISVRFIAGASSRTLTFPEAWTWLGGLTSPITLPANKVGMLSIVAYGTTDNSIVAGWSYNDTTVITGSGTPTELAFFDATRNLTSSPAMTFNSGTGTFTVSTTNVSLTGSTLLTLDAASFSIDGTGASNVTTTGANLTLSTSGSGDLVLSSADDITVDAVASFSIDGASASNVTVTGFGQNLTLEAAGGGTQKVLIQSAGTGVDAIDLVASAGGFSIDSIKNSNVTVTASGQSLTLEAAGGGSGQKVSVLSAGTGTAAIELSASAGGVTVTAASSFSVSGSANSDVTVDSANLTLQTTTSGDLNLTAATDLVITTNGLTPLTWPTLQGAAGSFLTNDGGGTLTWSTIGGDDSELVTTGLTVGDLAYVTTTNDTAGAANASAASNGSAPYKAARCVGIVTVVGGAGVGRVQTTAIAKDVNFLGSLSLVNGDPVFVSLTSGKATNDVSAFDLGDVISEIGVITKVSNGSGGSAAADVLLQPKAVIKL